MFDISESKCRGDDCALKERCQRYIHPNLREFSNTYNWMGFPPYCNSSKSCYFFVAHDSCSFCNREATHIIACLDNPSLTVAHGRIYYPACIPCAEGGMRDGWYPYGVAIRAI